MNSHALYKHLYLPRESSSGFKVHGGLRVGRFNYGLGLWQRVDIETAENFFIGNIQPVFSNIHQSGVFGLHNSWREDNRSVTLTSPLNSSRSFCPPLVKSLFFPIEEL